MAEGFGVIIVALLVIFFGLIIITGLIAAVMAGAGILLGFVTFIRALWVGPDQ